MCRAVNSNKIWTQRVKWYDHPIGLSVLSYKIPKGPHCYFTRSFPVLLYRMTPQEVIADTKIYVHYFDFLECVFVSVALVK